MRRKLLLGMIVLGLAWVPAASAMQLVSVTSPVHPGGEVDLIVRTSVSHGICNIRVHYRSHPALVAAGLRPKGALFAGTVDWRWRMPAHATRGTWSIDLACGSAGSLHATFVVR